MSGDFHSFEKGSLRRERSSTLEKENTKQQKQKTGLAILDDGRGTLSIWDTSKSLSAEIPLPENKNKHTARVVSLYDELYVQQGGTILKLKSNKEWAPVFNDIKYSRSWLQFITFANKLAVVKGSSTIIYDPETDLKKEVRGCGLGTGFSSTGTDSTIFAVGGRFTSNKAKKYEKEEEGWIDMPTMPVRVTEPATAFFQGKLYVIGGNGIFFKQRTVAYTNIESGHWITVSPMLERRRRLAVTVHCNQLYVFGGTKGLFGDEYVEELNNRSLCWKKAGRMRPSKGVISVAGCFTPTVNVQFFSSRYGMFR